jgi:hypothetical protein
MFSNKAKVSFRIPLKLKLHLFMSKFYKQKNDITFSMDEPQDIRKGEDLPIDPLKKVFNFSRF